VITRIWRRREREWEGGRVGGKVEEKKVGVGGREGNKQEIIICIASIIRVFL